MLEQFHQIHLSLNIKKYILARASRILLGHAVSKEGIKVDMVKMKVILDFKPLCKSNSRNICLVHVEHYRKFIRNYSSITFTINHILLKDVPLIFSNECDDSFQLLKNELVEAPITKFPDWSK